MEREVKARQVLIAAALEHLRSLRVRLDEVFKEADAGEDPFMKRVQPQAVLVPVQEFVRLLALQGKLSSCLDRAQKRSRVSFWFLVAFVVAMFTATVLGVLFKVVDPLWPTTALVAGALIFIVGGAIFGSVLLDVRQIDGIHVAVGKLVRDGKSPTLSEPDEVES